MASSTRRLPVASPRTLGLGVPTIMDRALAAKHGTRYVHLVAFAIDVDRAAIELEEDPDLPFGWDVVLTEAYLLARLAHDDATTRDMIEEVVLELVEAERDPDTRPPLGSQLPFALFDAIERGAWPAPEEPLFRRWKSSSKKLVRDLAPLWKDADSLVPRLAAVVLEAELTPPLAPPVRDSLLAMSTPSPSR
ncbi:MAG: hypothetical protein IT379_19175 [Deltaproteobacteria bacterium]|nr:hypothetical protein [Deltaproteobacteria bacterium]